MSATVSCAICDRVGGPLVICVKCGSFKKPIGRSAGMADMGYCTDECTGYRLAPAPGELWPGERYGDSLGHMDWHESEAPR